MRPITLIQDRNKDFLKVYFQISGSHNDWENRYLQAIRHEAPKFYISETEALKVIKNIMRGNLNVRKGNKFRMCMEIHRRIILLRGKNPGMNISEALNIVLDSPAPEFYISPRTAMRIIKNRFRK